MIVCTMNIIHISYYTMPIYASTHKHLYIYINIYIYNKVVIKELGIGGVWQSFITTLQALQIT